MCEPNHSIVQFEDPSDDDKSSGQSNRIVEGLKDLGKWLRNKLGWWHLSQMGSGHSESINWARTNDWVMPRSIFYEAQWWDRTIRVDAGGTFLNHRFGYHTSQIPQLAKDAAKSYADDVSIGSLSALRRFLETSIKETSHANKYIYHAIHYLFNSKGRDYIGQQLDRGKISLTSLYSDIRQQDNNLTRDTVRKLNSVISIIVGGTRNRKLLTCAWADDDSLWTPGQQGMQDQPVPILLPTSSLR